MGHANLVYHGAGWMEGGLTASFEKLVLDVEMLQMMAETIKPMDVSASEIAQGLETIASVPTGGHFFGTEHTLARYETAFYQPLRLQLAELRELGAGRRAGRDPARDQDLAGRAGNLRAAAARSRHQPRPSRPSPPSGERSCGWSIIEMGGRMSSLTVVIPAKAGDAGPTRYASRPSSLTPAFAGTTVGVCLASAA